MITQELAVLKDEGDVEKVTPKGRSDTGVQECDEKVEVAPPSPTSPVEGRKNSDDAIDTNNKKIGNMAGNTQEANKDPNFDS